MPAPTPPFDLTGLLDFLKTWMFPLIPVTGTLMVAYHAVMKAASTDEHAAAQHGRSIKTVLMYTAVALGANGLIALVSAFVKPGP